MLPRLPHLRSAHQQDRHRAPMMIMRIGPPRRPAVAPGTPPTADGESSASSASFRRPFDSDWVAQAWPGIRLSYIEILFGGRRGNDLRPTLRAVVHLGVLTPADVRVTARHTVAEADAAASEPLRHKGALTSPRRPLG
jgi:hypothetical protein